MRPIKTASGQRASRTTLEPDETEEGLESVIIRKLWGQPAPRFTAGQLSELTSHPVAEVEVALASLTSDWLITTVESRRGPVVFLADTQAARQVALLLTKNHSARRGKLPECQHHWLLESPAGEVTRGACRSCGEEKYFLSSLPAYRGLRTLAAGRVYGEDSR